MGAPHLDFEMWESANLSVQVFYQDASFRRAESRTEKIGAFTRAG
jgi:hypothetical protein